MTPIYLDHAATTPTDPKVLEAMLPYFSIDFGNPNAIYSKGRKAKQAIENARKEIAKMMNCEYGELTFTGSGTESNNLAVFGSVRAITKQHNANPEDLHIITSKIEHHAVLTPFEELEKEGYQVTYLDVDNHGLIDPDSFQKELRENTVFTSIIYANNEIGTIQPIEELAKIAHSHKNKFGGTGSTGNTDNTGNTVIFHTDACQAAGALSIDTKELGIDLMTINGSKIYGPKGIGVLFQKTSTPLKPLIYGGSQENGKRSGTENVPAIVGMAKALELAQQNRETENKRLTTLRNKLVDGIQKKIPRTYLNGHPEKRLPNNANMLILDIEGEALLLHLDEKGIEISTGSACDSKNLNPSHVLLATGLPHTAVHGTIRMTLGKQTTEDDINYVLETLPPIVEELRKISPVKIDEKTLNR